MTSNETHRDLSLDRIKLPLQFNVDRMMEEIGEMQLQDFIYYEVLPLTFPVAKKNIPIVDYADGTWADWHDSQQLRAAPYLSLVVNTFRAHSRVTLVRLLRLAPGAEVKEHKDPTLGIEVLRSVIRFTIPILTSNKVVFILNDSPVPMQPGECWYLKLSDPHRIINAGSIARINMSIDVAPNDWVRSLLSGAASRE